MDAIKILNKIYLYFGYLAVFCLSLSILMSMINFKKLNTPFRRIFCFLILNILVEIFSRYLAHSGINNLPLLHLYTLGEFILLSWIYESLIIKPGAFKNNYLLILFAGVIFVVLNSIFFESIYAFNPVAKTFVQISIITFAVIYFYNLTENQSLSPPVEKSLRLFNSAILIYYSGSLFIFMCNQIFLNNSKLYRVFWAFNAFLNFIFQLLILWGIWKVVSKKTHLSS